MSKPFYSSKMQIEIDIKDIERRINWMQEKLLRKKEELKNMDEKKYEIQDTSEIIFPKESEFKKIKAIDVTNDMHIMLNNVACVIYDHQILITDGKEKCVLFGHKLITQGLGTENIVGEYDKENQYVYEFKLVKTKYEVKEINKDGKNIFLYYLTSDGFIKKINVHDPSIALSISDKIKDALKKESFFSAITGVKSNKVYIIIHSIPVEAFDNVFQIEGQIESS